MEKLNYEQILEKIKAYYNPDLTPEQLEDEAENFDDFAYEDEGEIDGVGKFEEVEQHGGEGEGSEWYSVKYFPDHDIYIRVDGYYTSYHGTDFDGWDSPYQVKPQQKTITVYE